MTLHVAAKRSRAAWPLFATCLVMCLVMCLSLAGPSALSAMLKHIEVVTPRIGQRGTTVEVTIQGDCLKDPREVIFYKPGIRAVAIESLPNVTHPTSRAHGGRIEEQLKCRFEIAADCAPGENPFRIRLAHDLTTLATFHVTPFPVIDEDELKPNANDTLATALPVTPNVSVRGRLGSSQFDDIDLYRVPVVAGGRLSVEVDSVRLADIHYGDSEYDVAVRILDESGRQLAANDDNPLHVQDPLVAVKIPADADGGQRDAVAFVEVRRSVFTPGDHSYCVHIGTNARPLVAYPPGGPAGQALAVQLLGDPLGDIAATIAVPQSTGTFDYFGEAPSPVMLRSSGFPNVLEEAAAADTRVAALPAAVNGILDSPGDVDAYRISVGKGDRYRVRVFAAALGSPLDPAFRIRPLDADGKPGAVEVRGDDADPALSDRDIFGTNGLLKESVDPSVIWEPKAAGDYLLEVIDTSGFGSPTGVYRVEIDTPPDSVHTLLASTANDRAECMRTSGLAVPQGNRWTVNVSLPLGQGSRFRGDFELVASGLPAGVRLVSPRVPTGQPLWPVQFVADSTAAPGGAMITLAARAVDPAIHLEGSSQQAIPFINHSGGNAWHTVRLDRFALAVTDAAPFSIELAQPPMPLVRGGELAIPVRLVRRPGFDEPIDFQCVFGPTGVGLPPAATIAPGETTATLQISADPGAPLGAGPLFITATTLGKGEASAYLGAGRIRVSSEIVTLTVAEPFVELASEPASVRRGGRSRYRFAVKQKSPFDGVGTVRLLGLPKGVHTVEPQPTVTKDSTEITFDLEATDEALLGAVKGLTCEVTVKTGGQEIHQRAGNGTLRIDPKL